MVPKIPYSSIIPARHTITLNGRTVSYLIKRSSIAKRARIEVSHEAGLTVVIPKSYRIKRVPTLLTEKERWVLITGHRLSPAL